MLVVHIHLASFSAREKATRQRAFGWSARRRIWIRLSRVPTLKLASGTYAMQMARLKIIKKKNLLALVLKRASYEARRCFTSSKYSYSTRCNVATRDELRNRQSADGQTLDPHQSTQTQHTPVALVGVQKPDGRSNQTRPHVAGAGTHTHHPRPEPAGRPHGMATAGHAYGGRKQLDVCTRGRIQPRSGRE